MKRKRRVVAHAVPGAVQREQGVGGRGPRRHQQHHREGHAQRLHPLRQRRVVQVVRACPHVEEGDAPEADDRQPVGEQRTAGTLGQEVVHHAEEARRQEEGDGVVAVPPLRHGVLHAGEDRVALGAAEAHRDGEVVDDVQHRHDQHERHVVPVGDVDVRFLAPHQRAQVDDEIGHPDDEQHEVGVPLGLGVLLRLGDAHQVAGDGEQAEQVVAEEHEQRAELVGNARPRGALHDVVGRGDQRIAAEAEDDAGRVHGAQPAEARPAGLEVQAGIGELPGDPVADEQAEGGPDHGEQDAGLGWLVPVAVLAVVDRLGREVAGDQVEDRGDRHQHDQRAVDAQRFVLAGNQQNESAESNDQQKHEGALAFDCRELFDHRGPAAPP